ncbi:hypothetical protein D1007_60920 [Hordeum vulgare]|nr:hypothetical protein D1007_60920 [Hordeum vulgare]
MDAHTGAPLTPLYSRDPPAPAPAAAAAAAAAVENPSAGAAAATGAPPTVGLARSLFLPPRMTTPTGGVAPAPSRAAAAPSKLPNASEPKKEKTSAKNLPRPSELHVMRCVMRLGRKIHLRMRKNRRRKKRKKRKKTRKMVDVFMSLTLLDELVF